MPLVDHQGLTDLAGQTFLIAGIAGRPRVQVPQSTIDGDFEYVIWLDRAGHPVIGCTLARSLHEARRALGNPEAIFRRMKELNP